MAGETCLWMQMRKIVFYFSSIVANSCSHGLEITGNIEIKCLFHFKACFNVLYRFHTSCISALEHGLVLGSDSDIRAVTKRIKKGIFQAKRDPLFW